MRNLVRGVAGFAAAIVLLTQLGGCPTSQPAEFIAGGTGDTTILRSQPLVNVLSPVSDQSVSGGAVVEVSWQAFASTRTAVVNVIVDVDQDPNNGNETEVFSNLSLSETSAQINTTQFLQGTYYIGVVLEQVGEIVAYDYASGRITIDQRAKLYFTSPRTSYRYDRTSRVNPRIDVAWELNDPDSPNSTVDIYLDPDGLPNGNEILLYHSEEQAGDTFSFNLPTAAFEAGTYRLLAVVSDGQNTVTFYAPIAIRLLERLAGYTDLRDLDLATGPIAGAIFEGFDPRDNAGSLVVGMGDLDADGFQELLVVSQFAKPHYQVNTRRTGVGQAYLLYGRSKRFRGVFNLNSTGTLARGEMFLGPPEAADPIRPSRGVTSATVLGDWDGDGVREFAFGIPFTDSVAIRVFDNDGCFRTGAVIVCAGSSLRPDLNFPGGNVYELADYGQIPWRPITDPDCLHHFYGPNSPDIWPYRYSVDALVDEPAAQLGCRIFTTEFGDQCGEDIAAYPGNAMLIAVPNRDPVVNTRVGRSVPGAGVVSLYFGGDAWQAYDEAPWGTLLPHHGPYRYVLDDARPVAAAGGGFLRSSPGYFVDPENATPCIRAWGGPIPIPENTTRIYGGFPGAAIGNLRAVGDFSADGLDDFVIGSSLSNNGAGSCFIVLGRAQPLVVGSDLAIEELGLPMHGGDPLLQRIFDGIRVIGRPGDRLGLSQSGAGDFNNDGIPDVAIGSPLINNRRGGAAVFYGSRTVINLTEAEIPFDELAARGLGVIFVGEEDGDLAGARVAGAGDVDGDGNDDLLIAAPNRSVRLDLDGDGVLDIDRTACGVVYLIYGAPGMERKTTPGGSPGVLELKYVGTEHLPGAVFIGRFSGDHLGAGLGEQGDRSHGIAAAGDIDGDGRGDILISSVAASPRNRAQAGEAYLIYGVGE